MTTTYTADVRYTAYRYKRDVVIVADDGHGEPNPHHGQVAAIYPLPDVGSAKDLLRAHGWTIIGAWQPFTGATTATADRPTKWVSVRPGSAS